MRHRVPRKRLRGWIGAGDGVPGNRGTLVELSWYDRAAPLGGAFHSRRLRIVSWPGRAVAPSRRPRWPHRRPETALALADDPALDALITGEVAFEDLPNAMPDILDDEAEDRHNREVLTMYAVQVRDHIDRPLTGRRGVRPRPEHARRDLCDRRDVLSVQLGPERIVVDIGRADALKAALAEIKMATRMSCSRAN